MIEVHIYHHIVPGNLEEVMSKMFDDLKGHLDAANSALDGKIADIKAQVDALVKQIDFYKATVASGGLSPEEEAQLMQSIDDLTTKVKAMNPNDSTVLPSGPTPPTPTPTPTPATSPEPAPGATP